MDNYNDEFQESVNLNKKNKKNPLRKYKLKDEIIHIKNLDKDTGWCEQWEPNQSVALLPHPFRLCALGGPGRGKTMQFKQIFLKHQQAAERPFQFLYVITVDPGNSKEWDDAEPTDVMGYMPPSSLFDGNAKTLVVIDDYEFKKANSEDLRNLTTLARFVSTHRNTSVMMSYQSFFDTPSILRKICNAFIVFKPNGKKELTDISNRCGIDAGFMKRFFTKFNDGHDSLFIDLTKNTPYHIRHNIFNVIDYNEKKEEAISKREKSLKYNDQSSESESDED